jgi:hypothetical protein
LEPPAEALDFFMRVSLGRDDDVDGKMFACGAEFAFQSSWVADTAFRIIDETHHLGTSSSVSVAFDVGAYLIREILPAESSPSLLDDDGQAIVIEKIGRASNAVTVGGRPFVRADVIKMQTKERMHEVLCVAFILDGHRGSVLAAQA